MKKLNDEGTKLAKVLWYYNLIPSVNSTTLKIVCPFHEDINPSLIVNLEEGSWFCFGCNCYGDAYRFVKTYESKYNGLNDLQAYKKFLRILKSKKCSDVKISHLAYKDKPLQEDLYNEAWDYYYGLKTVNWFERKEQEISDSYKYLSKRGFSAATLNKVKAKVTYNPSYQIIFPMLDNEEFKGWVCRTTMKAIEKKRKYLYNEGFSRATTLVGNYGNKDYVFVVEGYMDRLKFVQYGEDNVVAILGWKMSPQQIQKLKEKGITHVISALDNDECGRRGTKYLSTIFKVTRFCYIKGVKDPGDMTKGSFDKMLKKTIRNFNSDRIKYKRRAL